MNEDVINESYSEEEVANIAELIKEEPGIISDLISGKAETESALATIFNVFTAEELRDKCLRTPEDSKARENLTMISLLKLASRFEDIMLVYHQIPEDSELYDVALLKLLEFCTDIEELFWIYRDNPGRNHVKKVAILKALELNRKIKTI